MENQKNIQQSAAENIAKVTKAGAQAVTVYEIFKSIIWIVVSIPIAIYLISFGVPWYFIIPIPIIGIVFALLSMISIRRISAVNLEHSNLTAPQVSVPIEPNEKVVDYIPGIIKTGFGLRGYEVLGAGKILDSENLMLLTNASVLFVTIPLPGGDKIIQAIDIPMWQWLAASKEIDQKAKDLISSYSLMQMQQLNMIRAGVALQTLDRVKINNIFGSITFVTKTGEKYSYSIRNKENREKAKNLFAQFL
ncbi:MAG: hypothetical protein WAP74_04360 [Patescibacteria group bacterium]